MTDFSMPCPRTFVIAEDGSKEQCGGEIVVEITSVSPGYPATRDDPGEGPEVQWRVIEACTECGLDDDEAQTNWCDEIGERADEKAWEYEQDRADARADAEYERSRDEEW